MSAIDTVSATLVNDPTESEMREAVTGWLGEFDHALAQRDVDLLDPLFTEDCWWRDALALTWDTRTMEGLAEIKKVVPQYLDEVEMSGFAPDPTKEMMYVHEPFAPNEYIQAFYVFNTKIARGQGVIRLKREEDGNWRAWTLLTDMKELIGHEEQRSTIKDVYKTSESRAIEGREDWYSKRERERSFVDEDPAVVIIGAGQSGVMLAARLEHLGVKTLIVERSQRLGDVWRLRYHNLFLHDPCWSFTFPYIPVPDNWPVFTPKEMAADFIEAYVWMLQLNAWTSANVEAASYDEEAGTWEVTVDRDGETRVLNPRHLVFATGNSGTPWTPEIEGEDKFKGTIVHSSKHVGGPDEVKGKKIVVVGSATSAHDIAEDAYEQGAAEVTMIQRGGTYVVSGEYGVEVIFGPLWSEPGRSPDTADADLLLESLPYKLLFNSAGPMTRHLAENDRELLDGLEGIGFEIDYGENDSGLLPKALYRAGGYYINKGCSQLLIEKKIQLKRGTIERFTETGVVYTDGTEADADIVVMATGWLNMREAVRPICGDELTDSLSVVWGMDDEFELNGVNRPTTHPALYFMAGGFQMSRSFSRHVALLIKGKEEGLR